MGKLALEFYDILTGIQYGEKSKTGSGGRKKFESLVHFEVIWFEENSIDSTCRRPGGYPVISMSATALAAGKVTITASVSPSSLTGRERYPSR